MKCVVKEYRMSLSSTTGDLKSNRVAFHSLHNPTKVNLTLKRVE